MIVNQMLPRWLKKSWSWAMTCTISLWSWFKIFVNTHFATSSFHTIVLMQSSTVLCSIAPHLQNGCALPFIMGGSVKLVSTVRRSHSQFNSLFQSGTPVLYPGRPDRQTAVFRWLVTEVFCHRDRPIEVDMDKFQALVRAFRYLVIGVTDSNY